MCGGIYDIVVFLDFEVFLGGYSIDVTPVRLIYVPKVLSVQVVPSGEVRMVPESPTDTKSPFP